MAASAVRVGNIWGPAYRASKLAGSADGRATFVFPTGMFLDPPIVVASGVTADGRDIVVSIVGAPTSGQAVLQARRTGLLPTVAASLLGFDVLSPAPVMIHLHAWRAS